MYWPEKLFFAMILMFIIGMIAYVHHSNMTFREKRQLCADRGGVMLKDGFGGQAVCIKAKRIDLE